MFIPNLDPITRTQVNHIDGNKTNNHYTNLEWVTPYENVVHSYQMGLNPGALPLEITHAICRMIADGVPFMKIVHHLNIDPWHVKNLKAGAYKHIRVMYGIKTKEELLSNIATDNT